MLHRLIGGFLGLYKVVPANEAHIRILMNKKETFCSREGHKSSYWTIPFITKLHKLPLTNLAIPVNDIKLNDKDMAKFVCDIMCFVNISDINLAVERLTLTPTEDEIGFDFTRLSEDLKAIMESVGRTVTTKQSILDIYMNRQLLDQAITKEVEAVFPKWGIQLVDLELKDIKDAVASTIIYDIERKVAAEIKRDADIKVAQTTKEAEVIKAQTEEIYRKRQIEKDQEIGKAEQEKLKFIAEKAKEAKVKEFEVLQVQTLRKQEIEKERAAVEAEQEKQVAIIKAEQEKKVQEIQKEKEKLRGESEKVYKEQAGLGEKLFKEQQAKGEAAYILEKGLAEAKSKDALQAALNKFKSEAITALVAEKVVAKDQAIGTAYADALKEAELKVLVGGSSEGFELGKLIQSTQLVNPSASDSVLKRVALPNLLIDNSKEVKA